MLVSLATNLEAPQLACWTDRIRSKINAISWIKQVQNAKYTYICLGLVCRTSRLEDISMALEHKLIELHLSRSDQMGHNRDGLILSCLKLTKLI